MAALAATAFIFWEPPWGGAREEGERWGRGLTPKGQPPPFLSHSGWGGGTLRRKSRRKARLDSTPKEKTIIIIIACDNEKIIIDFSVGTAKKPQSSPIGILIEEGDPLGGRMGRRA